MEDVLDSLSELMRSLTRIANKTPDAVLKVDLERLDRARNVLKLNSPPLDKSQIPVQSQLLNKHSVMRWVACSERMPDYDGMYVVFIHQPQPCGNVWQYQRIVENAFNRWVLEDENEEVKYWTELLPPPIA
jgi:hypothetical protein